ncbi:MAG TPA: DUF1365 domain-containing protein [Devosia sp.]|nr:DUF1365 domain-containing protein [Devosia sp.]
MSASAIFRGVVAHKRLRPKRHKLRYRVFSLLLDLDELPDLSLRLLKVNRPGLMSFREADHGDGGPLRPWVAARLAEAGIAADGPIRILCYPRMLGYVFNPLTVFFCHGADGTLVGMIYEVHNTHGERHSYVLPGGEGVVRHSCDKAFFVSPFMPMQLTYHFTISPPGEAVSVGIVEGDGEGTMLTASFAGTRMPLTDAALARELFAHPLMTLKVTAAIHWEAVKLLLKGLRVYRHHRQGAR